MGVCRIGIKTTIRSLVFGAAFVLEVPLWKLRGFVLVGLKASMDDLEKQIVEAWYHYKENLRIRRSLEMRLGSIFSNVSL